MARRFFHLVDNMLCIFDDEGVDLPDLQAVQRAALAGARDIIAADVRAGVINLDLKIEVRDEHGNIVYVLNFANAVRVIPR